ncbi:MAG: SIS domain-containing protein [Candidatus Heimdallarchaeota archaeon]|nr:SIS domain-containing protein [Candidatus Heimdallarchaeota archaeon]
MTLDDYMMSEMLEQPDVLRRILANPQIEALANFLQEEDIEHLILTGSGDSYCAAWYGSILGNEVCPKLQISHYAPFEYVNYTQSNQKNAALLGISVSGGTLRVLEALRYAKKQGLKTISFTDNPKGKVAQESDKAVFLSTSPIEALQISSYETEDAKNYTGYHHDVAQTKTYLGNIAALSILMAHISPNTDVLMEDITKAFEIIPKVIAQKENFLNAGKEMVKAADRVIFVSSGANRPTSLFGAYKMFEFTIDGYYADIEEYCHTKYFITNKKSSVIFIAPDSVSLSRSLEIEPVLRELIETKTLILMNEELSKEEITNSIPLPLPSTQVLSPLVFTIPVEFISYSLAKTCGFNTNTFRGGQETEKYVSGSFKTIRQSKMQY